MLSLPTLSCLRLSSFDIGIAHGLHNIIAKHNIVQLSKRELDDSIAELCFEEAYREWQCYSKLRQQCAKALGMQMAEWQQHLRVQPRRCCVDECQDTTHGCEWQLLEDTAMHWAEHIIVLEVCICEQRWHWSCAVIHGRCHCRKSIFWSARYVLSRQHQWQSLDTDIN